METFVAVLHILVAFVLIALVLVQDSKSGSVGVFGGGGANSVLGATGASTLAQKMTRWVAGIFAVTCILLSIFSGRSQKSILDNFPAAAALPAATAPATSPAVAPTGETPVTAPTGDVPVTAPTGQTAPAAQ